MKITPFYPLQLAVTLTENKLDKQAARPYNPGVDQPSYEKSRNGLLEKARFYKQELRNIARAIDGLDAAYAQLSSPPATQPPPPPPPVHVDTDYEKTRPFPRLWSHKAIIIEVAERMNGNFGVNEVKAAIDEISEYAKFAPLIQKATISARLKKMACPSGHLEIVEHGSGTRPTIYRVKNQKGKAPA